nr:VOC family protein [Agrococcus sp. ARC_14]
MTRIDHIDLKVPDLEATVVFLQTLGMQEVRRTAPERGTVEIAFPGDGQVVIELREDRSLSATTLNHIAVSSDALDADTDALHGAGVPVLKRSSFIRDTGRTVANISDPAGSAWQLTD